MFAYLLNENDNSFPNPTEASDEGLLAVGGDLSVDRLLNAYACGVFPWYCEFDPIMWWSPNPRCIFYPNKIKISKSLRQIIRNKGFIVKTDTAFTQVMQQCAQVFRPDEDGTWIVADMIEAYTRLHERGYAHSVEVWKDNQLVGGLYGVSLGAAFMGESMFHTERDASKVALVYLCKLAEAWGFLFIDNQLPTDHLLSLGACEISRDKYIELLDSALESPTRRGKWVIQ
jgi:leucyl/phenylalanyl-tRNA---protein transferase